MGFYGYVVQKIVALGNISIIGSTIPVRIIRCWEKNKQTITILHRNFKILLNNANVDLGKLINIVYFLVNWYLSLCFLHKNLRVGFTPFAWILGGSFTEDGFEEKFSCFVITTISLLVLV